MKKQALLFLGLIHTKTMGDTIMKTILKSALSVFAVAMFVCAMVAIFLIGFNHETYKAMICLCIIPFASLYLANEI